MGTSSIKDQAHNLVDKLPENSTWDDLMHEIYVRQAIEAGLAVANGLTPRAPDRRKSAAARATGADKRRSHPARVRLSAKSDVESGARNQRGSRPVSLT
jgi:hypothetical protein